MSRAYTIDGAWICWALREQKKKKEQTRYLDRALAMLTLDVDLNDPQHAGGKWLNVYRAAREALRRATLKAKKKSNPKPKKGN